MSPIRNRSKIKEILILFLFFLIIIPYFTIFCFNNQFLFNNEENRIKEGSNRITNNNSENIETQASTNLKLIATLTIAQDIAQNIVGDLGTVDVIVSGEEDPHTYEPKFSEIEKLREADILFALGSEDLEPWLENTLESITNDNPDLDVKYLINDTMEKEDPLLGTKNPHVWMDPHNIKTFANDITIILEDKDNSNAAIYENNNKTYQEKIDNLLDEINSEKANFKGLKVTVAHPAFFYLFELLEIERIAVIERGEGKEPSAEDIQNVIDTMIEENCHLVVSLPQKSEENVYEIARSTNSDIALLTPLLNVEVEWDGKTVEIDNYIDMIKYDLWALKNPSPPPSILEAWWIYIINGAIIAGILVTLTIIRYRKTEFDILLEQSNNKSNIKEER